MGRFTAWNETIHRGARVAGFIAPLDRGRKCDLVGSAVDLARPTLLGRRRQSGSDSFAREVRLMREAIERLEYERKHMLHFLGLELEKVFSEPSPTSAKSLDTHSSSTDNTFASN